MEERAAAPTRHRRPRSRAKYTQGDTDAEDRRTRESINRDRQGWDIFTKAHPMKHETARDRRRKTADKLENILVKRFLAREKLDCADAVWLRRAVRQLRSDRIR